MMPVRLPKLFAVALVALYAAGPLAAAKAQEFRGIMVEEGAPKAKKGSKKGVETEKKPIDPNRPRPRGSSYIPNTQLPRTVAPTVAPPSPGVYRPPPINSYGDRATNCIHSYPLNAGIGNNPVDRNMYIRQCAN